ncbi:MAG: hypothetical protein ABEJ68_10845 [Halobacteriaceae archaeon]
MSDISTADDSPANEDGPDGVLDVRETLTAYVEEHEHLPDECTIFRRDADESEIRTRWVLARGDAFVSLSEME